MDEVITPDLASLVCEQVRKFIITQGASFSPSNRPSSSLSPANPIETSDANATFTPLSRDEKSYSDPEQRSLTTEDTIAADLAKLQQAFDRQILYIIGKEQMRIKPGTNFMRKALLHAFLWMRDNTRTKIANLRVQTDRVIEVGFVKEV